MKYRILSFFGFYFITILFFSIGKAYSQPADILLKKADSLFEKRYYVESKEIYEQLLNQQSGFTPQMLLKLAYIEEGLSDFASALYYLSCYRNLKFDTQIEDKILKLSKEKSLIGYQEGLKSTLLALFKNFFTYINILIISVLVIWGCILFFIYFKNKTLSTKARIYFMTYLILSSALLNFDFFLNKEALIFHHHTLIMEGPSAGSKLIEMTDKGSKVEVLGSRDIWSKILWNGQNAYVRTKSIRMI